MQVTRTFSSPPLMAQRPAPASPDPQPQGNGRPDGFVGGVYTSSDGLLKAEGRLAGAGGTIAAASLGLAAVMKAAHAAPIQLTGGLGAIGLVCTLTTAAALGYAGWKGGGFVTDKALTGLDKLADHCSSKTGANLIKTLPRAAVAVGVASMGSVALNGMTLNLALPAAGWVAAGGLGGAFRG